MRVLSNMLANYPDRARAVTLYREMASRVASLQQPDGSWHASLLDPHSYPVKETSGTGFHTYAILWGLNNGLLDDDTYWPVVNRAWGTLAVDADTTETHGPSAFLLAGSRLVRYLEAHPHMP
jgi:unsaturated rhamnogalacturonyl hydrolase